MCSVRGVSGSLDAFNEPTHDIYLRCISPQILANTSTFSWRSSSAKAARETGYAHESL